MWIDLPDVFSAPRSIGILIPDIRCYYSPRKMPPMASHRAEPTASCRTDINENCGNSPAGWLVGEEAYFTRQGPYPAPLLSADVPRFAAKEAAMKALSPRRIKWHQAEVLLLPGQKKPLLVIHDAPSTGTDDAAHEQNIRKRAAQLSISHDGEYAIATVVAITAAPVPCE